MELLQENLSPVGKGDFKLRGILHLPDEILSPPIWNCGTDSFRKEALGLVLQASCGSCLIVLPAEWGQVWPVAIFESGGLVASRNSPDVHCRLSNVESLAYIST